MSLVALEGIEVQAGGRTTLEVDHLGVAPGEVVAVLGPTGAGKSTLLRVTHRLQRPARGAVRWRGEPLPWPAPLEHRRRIAMAFQDPLLFAGTVAENLAYGLAVRGVRGEGSRQQVARLLERFGIVHLAARRARTLSGGEAQRTALARALAARPELLLLDEPLASLDPPVRERLRGELLAILRERAVTCLWVTHDQDEAFAVADRVAILDRGRLVQTGTPAEVFYRPSTAFVATFVGTGNMLSGKVVSGVDGVARVDLGGVELEAVAELPPGTSVLACVRPEEVTLERDARPGASSARNRMRGMVVDVIWQGATARVTVDCGVPLLALVTRRSALDLGFAPGQPVWASVKATAVHLIEGGVRVGVESP